MSGIVGIFNLDGAPVDRQLLDGLTHFMTYRGPDAQAIRTDGPAGLGHTLLCTTEEAKTERQPLSLDEQVWIVADARVDAHADLLAKLAPQDEIGPNLYQDPRSTTQIANRKSQIANPLSPIFHLPSSIPHPFPPDVELILRAYHRWGEACVDHLLGDFAFAIWDARRHKLFCARDHFGIKPFFYAQVGHTFLFSNTLNCLRQHPQVSDRRNERAIGDFLLFDLNCDLTTTTFADIQRLPGGHSLTVTSSGRQTRRYWSLQQPDFLRYRRAAEYVEHFKDHMRLAVADRLRTERASIFLSGGLDSTTVAATAVDQTRRDGQRLELQGFTVVYDRLLPDRERHFTTLVAEALGIPVHFLVADDYELYQNWDRPAYHTPEPYHDPLAAITFDQVHQAAVHSRVALYGEGGDEALLPTTVAELLRAMPVPHLLADIGRCVAFHRLFPHWGTGVLARARRWFRPDDWSPGYPPWLRKDFEIHLDLPARWQEIQKPAQPVQSQVRRPAFRAQTAPLWASIFEFYDPGASQALVEVRLPFLDLRLLGFLLALPPIPWCVGKELLRAALRGRLPEPVCERPKSPLAGDPIAPRLKTGPLPWFRSDLLARLSRYVDVPSVQARALQGPPNAREAWELLRLSSLGLWLDQQESRPVETPLGANRVRDAAQRKEAPCANAPATSL